jgi:hypothetical protein
MAYRSMMTNDTGRLRRALTRIGPIYTQYQAADPDSDDYEALCWRSIATPQQCKGAAMEVD